MPRVAGIIGELEDGAGGEIDAGDQAVLGDERLALAERDPPPDRDEAGILVRGVDPAEQRGRVPGQPPLRGRAERGGGDVEIRAGARVGDEADHAAAHLDVEGTLAARLAGRHGPPRRAAVARHREPAGREIAAPSSTVRKAMAETSGPGGPPVACPVSTSTKLAPRPVPSFQTAT